MPPRAAAAFDARRRQRHFSPMISLMHMPEPPTLMRAFAILPLMFSALPPP